MNTIHIHSQEDWHDEAYIVTTGAALIQLRSAIDEAILNGTSKKEFMTDDGEGFNLHIITVKDEDGFFKDDHRLPYRDPVARQSDHQAIEPFTLVD